MDYCEIYDSALQLIGESPSSPTASDYEARAGYILANLTTILAPLDAQYLAANGTNGTPPVARSYVELTKFFPLTTSFAPASTFYLASMLVMGENEELSQRLYALYAEEIARFKTAIPRKCEGTVDRYRILR